MEKVRNYSGIVCLNWEFLRQVVKKVVILSQTLTGIQRLLKTATNDMNLGVIDFL